MMNMNNQTAPGGAGYSNSFQYGAGVGGVQSLTLPNFGMGATSQIAASPGGTASTTGYNGPLAATNILGEPFAVWLGMIILLVGLKFLSERPDSGLNPAFIKIGGYNFLAVGVTAAVFITILKVVFNKFKIPGVTEFANAL